MLFRSFTQALSFICCGIVLAAGARAQGDIIYVDGLATGPTHDGSAWCEAYLELYDALAVAGSGDTIRVADGIYKPTSGTARTATFQLLTGVTLEGGYAGCGAPDPDARDVALYETILSGDLDANDDPGDFPEGPTFAENSYHVVTGSGTGATAVLDGFTVTGGNANGSYPRNVGGGMYISGGSPTIVSCTFRANRANSEGGGMYGISLLASCAFIGNFAQYGGGVSSEEGIIVDCVFLQNTATNSGGALVARGYYSHITNCLFIGNATTYASDGGGGAVSILQGDIADVTNCTFAHNTSAYQGGAIYCEAMMWPLLLTLSNNILWGNSAPGGSEISFLSMESMSTVAVYSSDVQGGQAGVWIHEEGEVIWDSSNLEVDPLFVDADGQDDIPGTADDDLRLAAGSPCIDAADNDAVVVCALDLVSNYRRVDDGATTDTGNPGALGPPIVDMGPYEYGSTLAPDCNGNLLGDDCEVNEGIALDCNGNFVPDECEPDCQPNGVPDDWDISQGTSDDVNGNGFPDECEPDCQPNGIPDDWDISQGTSQDCQPNSVPDECDLDGVTSEDCNVNDVPDECDIAGGTSDDVDGDGVPDECEPDCQPNGVPDDWDISQGTSDDVDGDGVPDECEPDCQPNGVPDDWDISQGTSQDCQPNGVPDECEFDTDGDGVIDDCDNCDLSNPDQTDCQPNGVGDVCDLAYGASQDCNNNAVPDECEPGNGDFAWIGLDGGSFDDPANWNPNAVPGVIGHALLSNASPTDNRSVLNVPRLHNVCTVAIDGTGGGRQILQINNHCGLFSHAGVTISAGGMIDLDGGELAGETVNNAGGQVSGEGEVSAGLVNQGVVEGTPGTTLWLTGSTLDNQSTGSLIAPIGSVVNVYTPAVMQAGEIAIHGEAAAFFFEALANLPGGLIKLLGGTLGTPYLTNDASADVEGFGTVDSDVTNDGEMTFVADTQIVGNLENNGVVTIQSGILTILGDLTGSGQIIGDFYGRAGNEGLTVIGDYVAANTAILSLGQGVARIAGSFDVAINDPAHYDLALATVQMVGLPEDGPQLVEVMAADAGRYVTLPDAALFSVGTLRIGPTATTVRLADNHDNTAGTGAEALYVENLILEPGTTLDLAGMCIYYLTVTPEDPFDPASGVTVMDSVGALCLTPVGTIGSPLSAAYPDDRQRNRYVAFDPNKAENDGQEVAFKVALTSLTLRSCDNSGSPDVEGWPCRTDDDCRACSGSTPEDVIACWTAPLHCPAGETCDPTGALCVNDQAGSVGQTWWVGPEHPTLANDVHLLVSEPYRKVSTTWPAVVYVGDCEVVPGASYTVAAVDVGSGAESDPLMVSTAAKPGPNHWADCVGSLGLFCTGTWECCDDGGGNPDCPGATCPLGESCLEQWPPTDGFVNFVDVQAAVFTFAQVPGLTITDVANLDLHGNDGGNAANDPPNFVVNFSDIANMISAFQGYPYPYSDPADCPTDVGTWP